MMPNSDQKRILDVENKISILEKDHVALEGVVKANTQAINGLEKAFLKVVGSLDALASVGKITLGAICAGIVTFILKVIIG